MKYACCDQHLWCNKAGRCIKFSKKHKRRLKNLGIDIRDIDWESCANYPGGVGFYVENWERRIALVNLNSQSKDWFIFGGRLDIAGKKVNSFSIDLLRFDIETIEVHIENHAAAMLYYSLLLEKARREYKKEQDKFDIRMATMRSCAENAILKKGAKRPTKDYISARVEKMFGKSVKKMRKELDKVQTIYRRLELWFDAFKVKGFLFESHKSSKWGAIKVESSRREKKRRKVL